MTVRIGPGDGAATISLFGFDPEHITAVLGGENGGATLTEVNIVRSITELGAWNGQPLTFNLRPPAGQKYAVLLQAANGAILGATSN